MFLPRRRHHAFTRLGAVAHDKTRGFVSEPSQMPRQHVVTDVHLEVGDRVLVRGVRACVRMETATQVLVVFDQAQGGQQEVSK